MSEDTIVYQTNQARTDKRNRIKEHANRVIWVTFQREGIHKYPAAATDPNLADVSFLANEHRHIFHFKVAIEVTHNDRDIEFIQFKRWLEALYQGTLQLNYKSCEMICDDLYEVIATRYPDRFVEITVSEDGENGATITYNTVKPNLQVVI
jgi:hypothetical protein